MEQTDLSSDVPGLALSVTSQESDPHVCTAAACSSYMWIKALLPNHHTDSIPLYDKKHWRVCGINCRARRSRPASQRQPLPYLGIQMQVSWVMKGLQGHQSKHGWPAGVPDWSTCQARALEKESQSRQEGGEEWREINHRSKGSSSLRPPKHLPLSNKGSSARLT